MVGGGVAGLAAARALEANGFEAVVLEGRSVPGGRIRTIHDGEGFAYDLGATWIHGTEGNPVFALAEEWNLETRPTDFDDIALYDETGRPLRPEERDLLERAAAELAAEMEGIAREDRSLADAAARALEDTRLTDFEYRAIDWFLAGIENDLGGPLEDLSSVHADEGASYESSDRLFVRGFGGFVARLAEGLRIETNARVRRIVRRGETVRCETDDGRAIEGDAAVVTLPLGVFKADRVEFDPILPREKRTAIARLGMGTLNKVVFRFPEVFWDDRDLIGYLSSTRGRFPEIVNLARATGAPALMALCGGRYGAASESLPDEAIYDEVLTILRRIYGVAIPDPIEAVRTRWNADRYTLGSYSYIPVGERPTLRAVLAEPVGSQLFFAGEATSLDHPGTVHGAYLSGLRAAREVAAARGE